MTCILLYEYYLDLLSKQRRLEVGLNDNFDLQSGPPYFSDQRDNPERQDDVFGGSIPANRWTHAQASRLTASQCVYVC